MTTAQQHRATHRHFLFARPSFWAGTAQIMDFGNTMFMYNASPTAELADFFAMKNDWAMIGHDLRHAIHLVGADDEQQHYIG
jgi:hypothetical protein